MTSSGPGAGARRGAAPPGPAGPAAGARHGMAPAGPADGAPGSARVASITDDLRAFLASATGRDELLHIPPGTALFGQAVGLDSLTGTLLLREIQRRFGVDVAGEDLNLDSLAAFIAERAGPVATP